MVWVEFVSKILFAGGCGGSDTISSEYILSTPGILESSGIFEADIFAENASTMLYRYPTLPPLDSTDESKV